MFLAIGLGARLPGPRACPAKQIIRMAGTLTNRAETYSKPSLISFLGSLTQKRPPGESRDPERLARPGLRRKRFGPGGRHLAAPPAMGPSIKSATGQLNCNHFIATPHKEGIMNREIFLAYFLGYVPRTFSQIAQ